MTIAFGILLFLHIVSIALIFGIWVGNFKKAIVVPGQFHAALLAVITGFAMYFIRMAQGAELNHMLIGIKMVIALIICVAAFIGQKKYKRAISSGDLAAGRNVALAHTVGGLALVNIAIAVIIQTI